MLPNPNAGPLDRAAGGRSIDAERGREPLVFRRKARAEAVQERVFFVFFLKKVGFFILFVSRKFYRESRPSLLTSSREIIQGKQGISRLRNEKRPPSKTKNSRVAPEGEARAASKATTVTGPATLFVLSFFFSSFKDLACLFLGCSSAAEASLPGALFLFAGGVEVEGK